MISKLVQKPSVPGFLFAVSLVALLAFLACQPKSSTSGEVGLVWEAWGVIKDSYVEGQTLDSKKVVGNAIAKMLGASGKPAYPFLTELESVRGRPPRDVPKELTDVWRSWVLFREKWPDVELRLLAEAAVQGMLEALSGGSAAHLTPEAYDRAQERLRGTYQGIGAFAVIQDGKLLLSPMEDSPAQKAGLKAGDVILEVNGEPVAAKGLEESVDLVRGPAGTKVTLLVERAGEEKPLEFDVIRGDIDTVSVSRRLLPGAIGYIYISDFRENTPDKILDVLEELKQVDTLALILDLRDNPGGSIEAARKVASQFLSEGLFMYEIDREGNRRDWPIEQGGIAIKELPMVVVVNELTSSAAEAVAGALQDTQRAKILGTRTFGKGSANAFMVLSDGSAIYIPVSHWYTPLGRLIQGAAIAPDIEVFLTAQDRLSERDSQLQEAYNYLDNLLPRFR